MRLKRLSTEAGIRDDIRPSDGKAAGDFRSEERVNEPDALHPAAPLRNSEPG